MMMKRIFYLAILLLIAGLLGLYLYLPYNLPSLTPNHPDAQWNDGKTVHILPTVNHDKILIKVSFEDSLKQTPVLQVGQHQVNGHQTDSQGEFWSFYKEGLAADSTYDLQLLTASEQPLCDPWPLKTFPRPSAIKEHLRLMIMTCPGGHDAHREWFGIGPIPLSVRKKLINRGLSFNPDAMISTGDQIYWDLRYGKSAKVMGQSRKSKVYAGTFDQDMPLLNSQNEEVLKKAISPQISYLFGTSMRSTPSFFLLDDHDYFENDVAMKENGFDIRLALLAWRSPYFRGGLSFPPDSFMLRLGRTAQHLYLPEFLPDSNRPANLPGSPNLKRAPGISETYGTLRYGNLFEGLLYEGRRFLTLDGEDAVFFPKETEKWLKQRMLAEEAEHVVNITAMPFGWSAGKWLEWYPDQMNEEGRLITSKKKYKWQSGWLHQHNRLLEAAANMNHTLPLFIEGDLHCQAAGKILRSNHLSLKNNPVISILPGSVGTGPRMYPSAFRGTLPQPPNALQVKELLKPLEKTGFIIADFTPDSVQVRFFAWRQPQPVEAIDTLQPHKTLRWEVPNNQNKEKSFPNQ